MKTYPQKIELDYVQALYRGRCFTGKALMFHDINPDCSQVKIIFESESESHQADRWLNCRKRFSGHLILFNHYEMVMLVFPNAIVKEASQKGKRLYVEWKIRRDNQGIFWTVEG
jgi:hypothetical protein